jgi:cobalt-zinc-cadmium efflux system protein
MLTDAGARAGAMWATNLAARPARGVGTFGFKRAEILGLT